MKLFRGNFNFPLSARMAMSAMLIFTATGYFAFSKGMSMMLPDSIPFRTAIVYLTGIIEIAAAIGLLVPGFRSITGWLLILFFAIILPANIFSAFKHIDYQNATLDGNGPAYLWFRIPLQILFIIWVYLSTIRI